MRALPEPFRTDAEAASNAVVVDPTAWGKRPSTREAPEHLEALQHAVVEGEQVELGYVAPNKEPSTRVVHPLGLATKGPVWYLVADTDAGLRTFRVERVTAVEPTGTPVVRPEGFDLDEAWKLITERVDSMWGTGIEARCRDPPEQRPGAAHGLRHAAADRADPGRRARRHRDRRPRACSAWRESSPGSDPTWRCFEPVEVRERLAQIATQLTATYSDSERHRENTACDVRAFLGSDDDPRPGDHARHQGLDLGPDHALPRVRLRRGRVRTASRSALDACGQRRAWPELLAAAELVPAPGARRLVRARVRVPRARRVPRSSTSDCGSCSTKSGRGTRTGTRTRPRSRSGTASRIRRVVAEELAVAAQTIADRFDTVSGDAVGAAPATAATAPTSRSRRSPGTSSTTRSTTSARWRTGPPVKLPGECRRGQWPLRRPSAGSVSEEAGDPAQAAVRGDLADRRRPVEHDRPVGADELHAKRIWSWWASMPLTRPERVPREVLLHRCPAISLIAGCDLAGLERRVDQSPVGGPHLLDQLRTTVGVRFAPGREVGVDRWCVMSLMVSLLRGVGVGAAPTLKDPLDAERLRVG